jgi:hypothetical protein
MFVRQAQTPFDTRLCVCTWARERPRMHSLFLSVALLTSAWAWRSYGRRTTFVEALARVAKAV